MHNTEQDTNQSRSAIASAVIAIFKPVVKILLRNGITYKTAAEWLRWSYATVAFDDFKLPDRKQSKSRIAILTGLSRVEVDRLLNLPDPQKSASSDRYHRASKVLDGWVHDELYSHEGTPVSLDFEGPAPSFTTLVDDYAGGVPPRSILDELLRVKSIGKNSAGKITMKQAYFVIRQDEETLYQFGMLGFATSALLETIDHNIYNSLDGTRLQLIASNDNIPTELLAEIKQKLQQLGRKCVVDADSYMFKKTANTKATHSAKRAGISVYYFENHANNEV